MIASSDSGYGRIGFKLAEVEVYQIGPSLTPRFALLRSTHYLPSCHVRGLFLLGRKHYFMTDFSSCILRSPEIYSAGSPSDRQAEPRTGLDP